MIPCGALVGFGLIAERAHLGALLSAGCRIDAVVEPDGARQAAARAALPAARIYASLTACLSQEALDFVDICTPPYLHYNAALEALTAGVHVLCEKPLVFKPEQGAVLAQLASSRNLVVGCMHNWTQAPILIRLRALVHGGAVGPVGRMDMRTWRTQPAAVASAAGNWRVDPARAGGGILFDHGWHGLSILLRTLGQAPTEVAARLERRRYTDLAVEDSAEVWVNFPGGTRGHFEATWAAPQRGNWLSVAGEAGRIEIDGPRLTLLRPGQPPLEETFSESLAGGGYRPSWTAAVVAEFCAELAGRRRRGTLLHEALTVLEMLQAAYTSSDRGGLEVALGAEAAEQVA